MANDPRPSMSTRDTLLAYSEWLDSQHLIVSDKEGYTQPVRDHDGRSHDQLAQDFIAHWEADDRGADLAGRAWERLLEKVADASRQILDSLPPQMRESILRTGKP